nr:uncharacterized protein LOC109154451 [Ipomoea batatas]
MYQGSNQPPRDEAPKESFEDKMVRMFREFRHDMVTMKNEIRQECKQDLRNLETQVAQNSKALAERPQGALPSTTVNNPRERVQAVTLRSGRELPEPILKKSTNSKSPIEEVTVEEVLEEEEAKEKGDHHCLQVRRPLKHWRRQNTKWSSLTRKHVSDMHEILCIDDETNVDASLLKSNDVEFLDFLDTYLGNALYIHDLLSEDREEMEGDLRDVLLTKEKEGEKESVTKEKDGKRPQVVKPKRTKEDQENAKMSEDVRPQARLTTRHQDPDDAILDARLDARPSVGTKHKGTRCWLLKAKILLVSSFSWTHNLPQHHKMPPRTRMKEAAKKRRYDESGTSSGVAGGQSDLLIPGGRCLGNLSTIQLLNVEELQTKMVSGGYYSDYPLLDSYGCREGVEWLTSQPHWDHLFSWRGDTYEPVIYEFIATLEMIEESYRLTPSIKFTLFGEEYYISVDQLVIYLGFYTQDDLYSEWYPNLPDDFNTEASMEEFWNRITGGAVGRFVGKKHNTLVIMCLTLKAIKLLLGLTFGGRRKKLHKIYRTDRFLLWSLEMNEPIQMACMVKQWLQTQVHEKCPYIWIGPIVTPLCEGLGLQRKLLREKRKASMIPLGLEQLNRGYMRRVGDNPDEAEDELQPPAPEVGEGQEAPREYNMSSQYPEGMSHSEMMVPKNTLEKGEPSHRKNDETSSDEEGWTYEEVLNRSLMLDVEDLFQFRHFKNKEIIAWKYADAPFLDTFGIRREVERLTNQPFWKEICGWRNNTYTPVVREFVASLEVDEEIQNHWEPCIKFKLFNKAYEVSADALGNLLGFYTLHDQTQEWYHNLLNDFENKHQPGLFWWCIARPGTTWSPSYVSSRYIRNPEILVMWSIVVKSWMGRRTHNDNVTRDELFILWSMGTETPIHMGALCRRMLQRQHYEDSENIFVGPLVSRLCEGLGHEDMLTRESVAASMVPMSREDYLHLNLVPCVPDCEEHEHPMCPFLHPQQTVVNEGVALQTFIRQLYDEQEGERRGHDKRMLDAFQEVGHRIGRLEEEVRRFH